MGEIVYMENREIDVKKSFCNTFKQASSAKVADLAVTHTAPVATNVPAIKQSTIEPSDIDFRSLFQKATALIKEQSLIDTDPSKITLRGMELSKAKANAMLEALHNIVLVTHTAEILGADSQKFKRADEMNVLTPLLRSFSHAAMASEKSMSILVKKLEDAEESMKIESGSLEEEETKSRILNYIQQAYGACVDNNNKVVAGMARLIQLERFSQNRPWGPAASNRGNLSYIESLDSGEKVPDGAEPGATPARLLTKEEVAAAFKE